MKLNENQLRALIEHELNKMSLITEADAAAAREAQTALQALQDSFYQAGGEASKAYHLVLNMLDRMMV